MASYIQHRHLRPGRLVYDASQANSVNGGWRKVSTIPMPHGTEGKLIVWFTDGGAAIEHPHYRWTTK